MQFHMTSLQRMHNSAHASTLSKIVIYGIFALLALASCPNAIDAQPVTSTGNQPKITTQNGHLIFQAADNHNITFRSSGTGSVMVDDDDLKLLIAMVKENQKQIEQLRTNSDLERRLRSAEDRLDRLASISTGNFTQLKGRLNALESTSNDTGVRRMSRRVGALEDRVERLNGLLTVNECQNSPCRNGATCVDQYNGFLCQCTSGWQGPTCADDVNECVVLANTDLACQNGATCSNTQGSFQCTCAANFYGQRCTETHDDCGSSSNEALCGHGTCQNIVRTQPGQPNYKCNCDVGWTTSGSNRPICDRDLDECTSGKPPCSTNPPVQCINTPGSFICAQCPPGFTGSGYSCTDIDECLVNNGGCSMAPRVECINTPGSRTCGPCPDGYESRGNSGTFCRFVGVCGVNNGGCHPLATCAETPGIVGRSCRCPNGYIGNGMGSVGCLPSGGPCSSNPCGNNGRCQATGSTFSCTCNDGWSGAECNLQVNVCASMPCLNGGTCTRAVNGSFTCTCTSSFTGPTCQQPQDVCGGRLIGESGSLSYPRQSSQTYPHGVNCLWIITTAPSKMLILTFPRFKLESTPSCSADYVQIHDGRSLTSTVIGRYCGMTPPNTVNTTHNIAMILFHSDNSINHDGFEVVWNSAEPTCGGRLTGQSFGTLTSPSYPGLYPNSRDCKWLVYVGPGSTIMFTFGGLAIEDSGQNCTKDYLQIRDGARETDTLLGTYCGVSNPPPLRTTGPYANVWFHSDSTYNGRGFALSYTAMQGCGGAFTADSGVLISPNFPNPYPHDAQCIWTITVAQRDIITLNFTNIDLERHGNCNWDYVELRDGADESSNFVGRYCGNSTPPAFVSSGNTLWVKFRSDGSNRGAGFRAVWDVVCGGVYTAQTATLTSPSFPEQYPNDKDCVYLIRQTRQSVFSLTFTNFDIESLADSTTCLRDFLEIRSGETEESPLVGKYCGSTPPGVLQLTATALRLRFKSDSNGRRYGFRMTYTAVASDQEQSSSCGGTLTTLSGTIASPQHPVNYPHGANCTWFVTVAPGHVIRLAFTAFELERHSSCGADYIEIFDSSFPSRNTSKGRFCGSNHPPVITSTDNTLTVQFISDRTVSREGFTANYVALNATTVCGGHFWESVGEILSPNYPNEYPNERTCEWTVVMSGGRQILLNVTDFRLEYHPTCDNDYLEIRDGGFSSSPLIGKYCGTSIAPTIRSMSNRLFIKLVTNRLTTGGGFRIYYDGTASGCGGQLTGVTGSLTSPNYPLSYGQNSECYWNISVSAGSRVRLQVAEVNLETSASCVYDYLEIRDGGPRGAVLSKLCGDTASSVVQSNSNRMWIKFRSDASNHGRGFYATYDTNCNVTLSGSYSGFIQSPNFPDHYPNGLSCSWVIQATLGNRINATFLSFDLEPPAASDQPCASDYVELSDPLAGVRPFGRYCGQSGPQLISTTGRSLIVRFVSNGQRPFPGFQLAYITQGCGGELTGDDYGQLTSPNYPRSYPNNIECVWTITVTPGKRINITIDDFQMEQGHNCSYDVLEIYGGSDLTSPTLTRLCHTQVHPQMFTSTGNSMVVRFKSDISNSGRGFSAHYNALPSGCGGEFSTRSGTIMSVNYPQTYPNSSDCVWVITVLPGHRVDLQFLDFEVEGSRSGCNYDYVAFYDSADFNTTQLARFCGHEVPSNVVRSSGNKLYVRMRTDPTIGKRGFKANYTTGCGGLINADTVGDITSPHWPHDYNAMSNCTWILRTTSADDKITLTFTHMDIDRSPANVASNCSGDYVRVMNGGDALAPVINTFCGTSVPPSITSSGSAMTVIFTSDQRTQRTGFHAKYSSSTSACGATLLAESGSFTSPRYPDSYPNNVQCLWTIKSSPGNRVMLAFSRIDLEMSDECENDVIEVRDVDRSGRQWRFCGNNLPTEQIVGSQLAITFTSNNNISGLGFAAEFSSMFGGELTGNSGQVSSPLYPSRYPNSIDYTWVVTVDSGLRINITFQVIDVESPSNGRCVYDFIKIFDGASANVPELGVFCGLNPPDALFTSRNQMRILFHTDSSGGGQGFLLNWLAIAADSVGVATVSTPVTPVTGPSASVCGPRYLFATNVESNLTSPGFPSGYDSSIECFWIIVTSSSNSVRIQFTDFSLQSSPNCTSDYVTVEGSTELGRSQAVFCGSDLPSLPLKYDGAIIRFRSDQSVNLKGFALTYKSVCGGILRRSWGQISQPEYANNTNCTWTIKVENTKTVRLAFSRMAIVGEQGNCGGDYVEIFNGEDLESPSLGRYCGNSTDVFPPLGFLMSSDSYVTVQFVSDGDGLTGNGFSLEFREMMTGCGGFVNLSPETLSAIVTSPGYPIQYTHNVECTWLVTVPDGKRVQLRFDGDFQLEPHSSCAYDYVELRDGTGANAPLVGSYCGWTPPKGVPMTVNNRMTIKFRTDSSSTGKGFKAILTYGTCGGHIGGANGTLSSPNYPSEYENNTDCEWFIDGLTGHYLQFSFVDLRLSESPQTGENCTSVANVEIRDANATGRLLGIFCGNDLPTGPIESSDSAVYVRFHSNSANQSAGFQLNFVSSVEECGGELTTSTGVISSPNFPGVYAHNRRCRWLIRVQRGRRVKLTMNVMDIESYGEIYTDLDQLRDQLRARFDSRCGDFIQVINGYLPLSPTLGVFCGKILPGEIESSGNTMVVMFKSDTSVTGQGFQATYTSDNLAECGGELVAGDSNSVIESPGFGGNSSYNISQQCIWTISSRGDIEEQSSDRKTIVLRFIELDLEPQPTCIYDFVELREGTDENGVLIDHVCKMNNITGPLVFASPSSSVWIRFVSDHSLSHSGFQLNYTIASCGGVRTRNRGLLSSPSSSLIQSGTTDCVWLIQAPVGSQIRLTVKSISLGTPPNCTGGYIDIRNGGLSTSPSTGLYCSPFTSWQSQSNQVRIIFHTETDRTEDSFQLLYEVISQACGGVVSADGGYIASPNYPNRYNASTECIWEIQAPSGYHIVATFNETFQIISTSVNCSGNYVKIAEPLNYSLLPKTCGTVAPQPVISSGNVMRVKFRSSSQQRNAAGFMLTFTIECGAKLIGTNGTITSPDYPAYYRGGLNCTYDIVGDPQKYTILSFTPDRFSVRALHQIGGGKPMDPLPGTRYVSGRYMFCNDDFIDVSVPVPNQVVPDNNNVTTSPQMQTVGRFCGRIAPSAFSTLGFLRIRFITGNDSSDRGWVAKYQLAQCGGLLTQSSGRFESLSFPEEYPHNVNCTWIITVPDDKLVRIKFEKFSLEGTSHCDYDYVRIFNGPLINSSTQIGRYCGQVVPDDIISTEGTVVVNFQTDGSVAFGGFSATYKSVYGVKHGCGGLLKLTSPETNLTLTSPDVNGDGNYENDLECTWTLIAPADQTINVRFTDFAFEQPTSSGDCVDYLEIRDGIFASDPLAGRYCGSLSPFEFNSSTNMLSLTMMTDYGVILTGFKARITTRPRLCGGDLYSTINTTSLIINNLSVQGRRNVRCLWVIDAPILEQIEFNITNVDLASDCSSNYLEVRDFPHRSAYRDIRACNGDTSQMHLSMGRSLQVELAMDATASSTGRLQLDYRTASCNRVLTSPSGRIVSPHWPGVYPASVRCEVRIITPPGNKLVLFFSSFEVEIHSDCIFDYLQIFNGTVAGPNNVSLAKLCGSELPNPVSVDSNSALLVFATDSSVPKRGYDITYTSSVLGCGAVLMHTNGTFASPEYPGTVTSPVTCSWTIRTMQQRLIKLSLSVLPSNVTESSANSCVDSYVAVYNGQQTSDASEIGRYCISENIATLTSTSNVLTVVYVAGNNTSLNVAFNAIYWTSSGVISGVQAPVIVSEDSNKDDVDYHYDKDIIL